MSMLEESITASVILLESLDRWGWQKLASVCQGGKPVSAKSGYQDFWLHHIAVLQYRGLPTLQAW